LNIYFKEIVTSEGSNSLKPNKEIFEFALNKSGAIIQESIMIGDSIEVDILGAKNAGMDQVFVNHGSAQPEVGATYTIHSLKELEKIF
jgi:putative hydrolase of the HAD superfamily